jgi:hypothetical protein
MTRSQRARLLVVAAVINGVLLAGCGASPPSQTRTTVAGAAGAGSTSSRASHAQALLAFARCMRANGVPSFPDPNGNGSSVLAIHPGPNGETINGVAVSAPAFQAAQAKCRVDMPQVPTISHAQAESVLAQAMKFAQCLRGHGVPNFPDPQISTVPGGQGYLVRPGYRGGLAGLASLGIDPNAPAFQSATQACGGEQASHVGGFGAH